MKLYKSYAEHFIEYLKSYPFDSEIDEWNIDFLSRSLFNQILNQLKIQIFSGTLVNRSDFRRLLISIIRDRRKIIDAIPVLLSVTEEQIISRHSSMLADRVRSIFPRIADQDITDRLVSLAARHMISQRFSSSHTGIVFAGFGSNEIFPSLREYYTDGRILGELKIQRDKRSDTNIDPISEPAVIIPFAVRDMTERFLDGVDRRYQIWIDRTVRKLFEENCLSIVEKYVTAPSSKKRGIKAAVSRAIRKNLEEFSDKEEEYRRQKFSDPVIDMVELLPKEELAHLAESLVNLTSLRRRVTMDLEFVGGPIDVAVISKGDGFIWIKRKHYFQPDLNKSYMLNYLRSGG